MSRCCAQLRNNLNFLVPMKKCKECKRPITNPRNSLQVACSAKCAQALAQKKLAAKRKAETREMKEQLMTHSEWLKLLQVAFNTFIRKRDQHKGCVSCGKPLTSKFDAGHFFSVGSHPELRFDEDNVHGQCVPCNQHKHGNLLEYAERLPQRIGVDRLEMLKARKGQVSKLSTPEIKEKIQEYRKRAKALSLNQ
jgi:predicted nucleic acid-binding Zn ribbon protein